MRRTITRNEVTEQLLTLGVKSGSVLLVHTAFSKVSLVEGGPRGLIEALQAAVGRLGTLAMPSMSDDDDHPFDPRKTDCPGMGIVADTFWRLPGAIRSDSPHAFAATGPKAAEITAPHPLDAPHGLDSPVGRIYELDGYVLLLGVGHDANTTIHLAENLAGVRYRRPKTRRSSETGDLRDAITARSTTAARTSISWISGWMRKGSSDAALSAMRRRAWLARET
jgi:aminoglycoside N3'-acetyltransferase